MRILFAAGGTAGHINPALAIAAYIKQLSPNAKIEFAGRIKGMEYKLVTGAGYAFHNIEVNGIQRSFTLKNIARNFVAIYHLALSAPRANQIIKSFKPDIVIGTGGYVSAPVLRAAQKMKIPTIIHEQNAFPGITNKLLAKGASEVLAAVPDAVEKLGYPQKTTVVGNPVRGEVYGANREQARKNIGAKNGQTVILSFGGSLGAEKINQMVAPLAAWHIKNKDFLHIHATGSIEKIPFSKLAKDLRIEDNAHFIIKEYIEDMPQMLAAADLVISRAGALTLAEIAASGKASILIPSPNVAENHQYFNALSLAKLDAAQVIEEKSLTAELLIKTVDDLTQNESRLMQMGQNAKQLSMSNSLPKIWDCIKKYL